MKPGPGGRLRPGGRSGDAAAQTAGRLTRFPEGDIKRRGGAGVEGKGQQTVDRGKVETVLNRVRPMLQADGGDVELVGIEGGVVKVRLKGTCGGCPFAAMTIKNGIEAALKAEIPAVEAVQAV